MFNVRILQTLSLESKARICRNYKEIIYNCCFLHHSHIIVIHHKSNPHSKCIFFKEHFWTNCLQYSNNCDTTLYFQALLKGWNILAKNPEQCNSFVSFFSTEIFPIIISYYWLLALLVHISFSFAMPNFCLIKIFSPTFCPGSGLCIYRSSGWNQPGYQHA